MLTIKHGVLFFMWTYGPVCAGSDEIGTRYSYKLRIFGVLGKRKPPIWGGKIIRITIEDWYDFVCIFEQ